MAEPAAQDDMLIEWDVELVMDDGLILRGDVFRPRAERQWPVLLTYGPYAKGLAFQQGYPSAWQAMIANHPDVARGSTNKYQNWEVVDPEKWVPHGYVCVRVDSRGTGRSPGYVDHFSPGRPATSINASNGPAPSAGRMAMSALTASRITPSTSGTLLRCSRRI